MNIYFILIIFLILVIILFNIINMYIHPIYNNLNNIADKYIESFISK